MFVSYTFPFYTDILTIEIRVWARSKVNRTCYIGSPYVVYFVDVTGSRFVSLLFIQSFFFLFVCMFFFHLFFPLCILYKFFLPLIFRSLLLVVVVERNYRYMCCDSGTEIRKKRTNTNTWAIRHHHTPYVNKNIPQNFVQFIFRMLVITDNTENTTDNTTDLLYNKCCAV